MELDEGSIGNNSNEAEDEKYVSDGEVPFWVSLPLGDSICKFWNLR
jgi:hypothetical protein